MATRTNKVEVEIVAVDEASPKIDKLEKKIDGLEADEARIIITANIERLDSKLTEALAKMKNLDGDELTVQARLVGTLEQDLIDANKLFKQLDGKTGKVKLTADTSSLDNAKRKMEGLVSSAEGLPGPLGEAASFLSGPGGIVAGLGAATVGAFHLSQNYADTAINAQTLANLTGSSVEDASRWLAVIQQAGIEYNDLADIALQVNQVLQQQPDLVARLGINLNDGRDGLERINQLVEILNSGLFTASERSNIMSQVFGEEGVRQISGLITQVGDLSTALGNVKPAQIMDEADVQRAMEFKQEWGEAKANINAAGLAIGEDVIPLLNDAVSLANTFAEAMGNIPSPPSGWMDWLQPGGNLFKVTEWMFRQWAEPIGLVERKASGAEQAIREAVEGAVSGSHEVTTATTTQATAQEILNRQMGEYIRFLRDRHNAALPEINDFYKRKAAADAYEQSLINVNIADEQRQRRAADQPSLGQELNAERQRQAAIGDTEQALQSLADTQDELRADALEQALSTKRGPLDTLTRIQNINQEIRDLADFIKTDLKGVIPNLDDPMNEAADDVLSRLDRLASDMNTQLVDEFERNGEAAALAMANSWINTIAAQTGISAEELKRRFGWDNLEVTLKVKVDDTALAQTQLDLLKGLTGETPFTAALQLALDAKSITPQQVMTLVQEQFRFFKIPIPSEIAAPDGDAAIAAAEQALYGKSVSIPVVPDFSKFPTQFQNGVALAIPPGNINVFNPPGTPPTTVANVMTYGRRNGDRPDT